MKWMIFTAAVAATCLPQANADLAGRSEVPVQRPAAPQPIGPIIVQQQESVPLTLTNNIAGVSLGSSFIANVVVHDKHTIVITGRAFGSTSLHILDELGNVVVDTQIRVVDASQTRLNLVRAGENYTLDCTPRCQPAPAIGDNLEYFENTTSQATMLARDEE